ncbi:hypothetical protein BD324DRAFT_300137 [Kockovaella imperatae]|uniref:Uncharacterized protein n=1 Tax=Kockovaella imperatae TaxID=4999 RepID=A0A1Y1ULM5_9TREE|nr:hypothetical protein BD324DRAFT_300137 [Kockovaella imperatae]ORX38958.1 hypothetical protein BD324DRAFT_300137 [Kockovaella imperatae]
MDQVGQSCAHRLTPRTPSGHCCQPLERAKALDAISAARLRSEVGVSSPNPGKNEKPSFAPRAQQKKQSQEKYKDRAEMRRQGMDDEYKPVEKLLADLEERAKDAGEDSALTKPANTSGEMLSIRSWLRV